MKKSKTAPHPIAIGQTVRTRWPIQGRFNTGDEKPTDLPAGSTVRIRSVTPAGFFGIVYKDEKGRKAKAILTPDNIEWK